MQDLKSITVQSSAKVREAMIVLDQGAQRIVLITDEKFRLVGVITDGDIRRGLINGLQLDDNIDQIVLKTPVVCRPDESPEKILELAIQHKIYQIPVVDQEGILVGLHQVEDLIKPEEKSNPVVLMAGGQGIRLRPLTENKPKPLLNVGGRPILETIIKNFKKHGFVNFYLSVNFKSEMIQSSFGDGSDLGVNIQYIEEERQLGTAGALAYLKEHINESFFVMNGDILTNVNFNNIMKFHLEHEAKATMCVRTYDHQIPYGVIQCNENDITDIVEKPVQTSLVNAGIYILEPDLLKELTPNQKVDMPNIFKMLIEQREKAVSYLINDYWVDIGRLEELRRADAEFHEVF